jgi:predicted MPP superfamily phosphohydrolase
MKWLHLSDLHFHPVQDGTDTNYLREKLKDFLIEKRVHVDKLFLTGDFRDASRQADSDENAKKAVQYILEISEIVEIVDYKNILCVPGNHDLDRYINNRQELICKTKRSYRTQEGTFENTSVLVEAFTFYKRVLNQLYGKEYTEHLFDVYKANPHRICLYNDCNIMMMNTELFAGEIVTTGDGGKHENDAGTIIVGSNYVLSSLFDVKQTGNPTIVLGHRGLELFEATERRKLLSVFKDNNVCMYLCGHSHDLWYEEYGEIPQITVGCIKEANGVKAGFTIGEFCSGSNIIKVTAFTWDNNNWSDYSHFSKDGSTLLFDIYQNGLLSGSNFPLTIKIVIDGRVRQFNCRVPENGMTFGVEHSTMISVGTGDLVCIIRNNQYSDLITYNHKFILSKAIWKVIGIDTTTPGVTKITCKRELKGSYDDLESGISGINQIAKFKIELFVPIDSIGLNQQLKFTPYLIRDIEHIKDAKLCVSIANESVLAFDGINITGLSLGETDITVYWDDDKDICETFHVVVVSEPVKNIFYRVYKHDIKFNSKSYYDFSVITCNDVYFGIEKYVNCELTDIDEAFNFHIVSVKDGTVIPVNPESNCEIKVKTSCLETGGKYLLTVSGESTIQVEFKGMALF